MKLDLSYERALEVANEVVDGLPHGKATVVGKRLRMFHPETREAEDLVAMVLVRAGFDPRASDDWLAYNEKWFHLGGTSRAFLDVGDVESHMPAAKNWGTVLFLGRLQRLCDMGKKAGTAVGMAKDYVEATKEASPADVYPISSWA